MEEQEEARSLVSGTPSLARDQRPTRRSLAPGVTFTTLSSRLYDLSSFLFLQLFIFPCIYLSLSLASQISSFISTH